MDNKEADFRLNDLYARWFDGKRPFKSGMDTESFFMLFNDLLVRMLEKLDEEISVARRHNGQVKLRKSPFA